MEDVSLLVDLKGEPGINCNGFCKFCYFRKVDKKNPKPLGCRYCQFTIGCDYCTYSVREMNGDFVPLPFALMELQSGLMFKRYKKVNLTAGGDVSCYPQLRELCRAISNFGLRIHLGYTSGKGFDNLDLAKSLVEFGVDEVTFSVFSTDPKIRKEWMNDKNAETALKCLKYFCENCEVHCAIIVIPGVNDGDELKKTISDLVDWGAKAVILMRFANKEEQGLILENAPIIEGINPHSIDEFKKIVDKMYKEFGKEIRVSGTPLHDPITGTPFALAKEENRSTLERLKNKIEGEATIITGNIAYPFLKKIFDETSVNVVKVNKDIADLITAKDLERLNLKDVKETVFIPPKAFVHDLVAEELLRRDGVERMVVRGVEQLTLDGEVSGVYTKEEALKFEIEAFEELIGMINFFGMKKR
ncbi:methanogenesis marker protein 10 [Methanocaldococcus vulcanius M7]|uniref:Methanogenesis marker protein 10 n=1 Tax=Methanocaldococcus vulcanius (strain ATCC 700851 / DSM 12094 / M7) TaxID=579137 RepID=C9REL0_METVM|nr:methyl coenzyme M reductase-arginine methyltransferase Mmp10 [Methanocaldococcus vulcanius]ACX72012.1 methanogenesis marker protein 10 [Methanocaldococcus vulcanius M7]